MKIKDKSTKVMGAGVHLAVITDVKYARRKDGEVKHTREGQPAVEIKFKNKQGEKISEEFWLTDNAQWMLDNLFKAIGLSSKTGSIDVKLMIGKKLFIMVAREYHFVNGEALKDDDGIVVYYSKLVPKFFPMVSEDSPPIIEGDPARSPEGKPSGDFVKSKSIVKPEDSLAKE